MKIAWMLLGFPALVGCIGVGPEANVPEQPESSAEHAMVATERQVQVPLGLPEVQAQDVFYASDGMQLHGYLSKPPGNGPFPAVVYNHGSERNPGTGKKLAPYFISQGYAFFAPHRRGHGQNPGTYLSDEMEGVPKSDRALAQITGLEAENHDVLAAIAFMHAQSYIDGRRIAVMGCSYGGIETILTAEHPQSGVRAAVDFAGAAMSWGSSPLRDRLTRAVRNAQIPIFFVQAENDFTTQPSIVLAAEATNAGKQNFIKIFPPAGDGSHGMAGHTFCVTGAETWGPDVMNFLRTSMQ